MNELISEIEQLKRDLAFKKEELQALYMEYKNKSNLIDDLKRENHSLKQQIKQLEKEAEEMLQYP
jgi:predicted  nucleic acid-binding Zn-ribbon protein